MHPIKTTCITKRETTKKNTNLISHCLPFAGHLGAHCLWGHRHVGEQLRCFTGWKSIFRTSKTWWLQLTNMFPNEYPFILFWNAGSGKPSWKWVPFQGKLLKEKIIPLNECRMKGVSLYKLHLVLPKSPKPCVRWDSLLLWPFLSGEKGTFSKKNLLHAGYLLPAPLNSTHGTISITPGQRLQWCHGIATQQQGGIVQILWGGFGSALQRGWLGGVTWLPVNKFGPIFS